jgi:ABC-2 type transport system ATP-binding protein
MRQGAKDMLVINNVSKKYRNKLILDDVSLNIKGVFGLLGQNGAGKSTLLNIIATATKFSSGELRYKDIPWTSVEEVRKIIGYLPQNFSMFDKLTVYESLEYFSVLKGLRYSKKTLEEVLSTVNLIEVRNKKIKEISGGMLRRLGIGQALLGDPEILVVDEPTSGLDLQERIRFRNLLREIGKSKIILISSHIVEDLEAVCNKFAILKKGKVIVQGTKEEIIRSTNPPVWDLLIQKVDLDFYLKKYYTLSIFDATENNYKLRILSSTPPNGANRAVATLEDSYIFIGSTNRGVQI